MITTTTVKFENFDLNEINQIKANAVEIYKHLHLKRGTDESLCDFMAQDDDTDGILDLLEKHLNFVKCNREKIYNLEWEDFNDFLSKIDNLIDETISELYRNGRSVEITEADINRYIGDMGEDTIWEAIDGICTTSEFVDFLKDHDLLVKFLAEKVF